MAIQAGALDRVLQDCARVLKAIRSEQDSDRTPYAVDLRRLLEAALVLRFGEYLQFLEKFGFLTLNRRTDVLNLTRPGKELIEGKLSRTESLQEDAAYHFGDRLNEIELDRSGISQIGAPIDDRYLPRRTLGSGALSRVSEGIHLTLNRPIAIKKFTGLADLFRGDLTPEIRKDLKARIEDNANIESDFVVSVLDVNVEVDIPYVVLEYCSGGNLRGLMDRQALQPNVALTLFRQACLGLKSAHERGLIHGDLKPENLLLTQRGNIKLADLGFSQLAQSESLSQQRAYVGYSSLGYLAPEMFRQDRHYTMSSDIYSMGIILYELLVGRLPGRRSPLPSQVVEDLPEGLDDLFDLMASDDQDERIESMDEVLKKLTIIMGIEDKDELASLFLVAPFDLPEACREASEGAEREGNQDYADGASSGFGLDPVMDGEESPSLDARGLETVNSAGMPADDDKPADESEPPRITNDGDAGTEEEPNGALMSSSSQIAATVDPSVGVEIETDPDADAEGAQVGLDRRSQTEVHTNDSTSMLDSLAEDS